MPGFKREVVRADEQHDRPRRDAVELAVPDPPEDVLGAVADDAEVGRLPAAEVALPVRLELALPVLGDRVAEHVEVDVAPLRLVRRIAGADSSTIFSTLPSALWTRARLVGLLDEQRARRRARPARVVGAADAGDAPWRRVSAQGDE